MVAGMITQAFYITEKHRSGLYRRRHVNFHLMKALV
ncbi:hypothetical protein J2X73_003650 [Novosphingobium sp. 1748]|nr:hypothetical protein [Novosphingobium sp. 1748]